MKLEKIFCHSSTVIFLTKYAFVVIKIIKIVIAIIHDKVIRINNEIVVKTLYEGINKEVKKMTARTHYPLQYFILNSK